MLPGALRVQSISGGFFSRDYNFTVDPAAMAARGLGNTPADPSNAFESRKRVLRYQPAAMQVFPRRGTTVPCQSTRFRKVRWLVASTGPQYYTRAARCPLFNEINFQ